jgi:hypothetical protein
METFFGGEAADLDRDKFLRLLWRERKRLGVFLEWVEKRRQDEKRR